METRLFEKINNRVIIAAGGTGGHIYPGICLAKELKKRGYNPVFIVKKNDLGIKIVKSEGYQYFELNFIGFPREFCLRSFVFFFKLFFSVLKVIFLIVKIKPVFVIGLGSYISFPVVFVSKIFSIKTFIHEQNVVPGLANRFLSKFADRIAVSFPETKRYFPEDKTFYTGNFIREELFKANPEDALRKFNFDKSRFTVLIFGGSQGAHIINLTILKALKLILDLKDRIQFLHLTGKDDFPLVKNSYKELDFKAEILEYLDDMASAYAVSNLVICRAGATTIAEILELKKFSILIPYPYATEDHQTQNARYLEKLGFGVFVPENELSKEKIANLIRKYLTNPPVEFNSISFPPKTNLDKFLSIL